MSSDARWSAEALSRLAVGYWHSTALNSAAEVGLFDRMPGSAADVAGADLDGRAVAMLLEALADIGVVTVVEGRYDLEPTARPFLVGRSGVSLTGALRYNAQLGGLWAKLPELLRTGRAVAPAGDQHGGDPQRTKFFVLGMHSRAMALMPAVAGRVDLGGCATLLDVGAGPGTVGRMLAERYAGLAVTLMDLPAVTEVARGLTAAHPAAARVTHVAGDYVRDALPGGFDAVLYSGALHQHREDAARAIVRKVVEAVRPRGRVWIVDVMRGRGDAFASLFAVNMALLTDGAAVYTPTEVAGWLGDGVVGVEVIDAGLYTIVGGRRA